MMNRMCSWRLAFVQLGCGTSRGFYGRVATTPFIEIPLGMSLAQEEAKSLWGKLESQSNPVLCRASVRHEVLFAQCRIIFPAQQTFCLTAFLHTPFIILVLLEFNGHLVVQQVVLMLMVVFLRTIFKDEGSVPLGEFNLPLQTPIETDLCFSIICLRCVYSSFDLIRLLPWLLPFLPKLSKHCPLV